MNPATERSEGRREDTRVRSLLCVAAVERELAPLRALAARAPPPFAPRFLTSGAGKASAALAIARALSEEPAEAVLQVGCAGALPQSGLEPGDVVVASGEILGDEGAESHQGFLGLRELGLPAAERGATKLYNEIPVHRPSREAVAAAERALAGAARVAVGPLVTVSTGSGTDRRAAELARRWPALAESMEGAAAALAAWVAGVPFLEVRGISNLAGDRRRAGWEIDLACEHAARAAWALVLREVEP